MTRRAWAYIFSVFLAGAVLSGLSILHESALSTSEWLGFAVLTSLTILAQFLEAEAPGRQSYYPHLVFVFAGVLLLHSSLFVLLVFIPHLVGRASVRPQSGIGNAIARTTVCARRGTDGRVCRDDR